LNNFIAQWIVDFYINDDKIIECLGDYWHCNPSKFDRSNPNIIQKKNIDRDKRKEQYCRDNNIAYLFLWEKDIKHNNKVQKQIEKFVIA
jgi:G:T-mismatch repair DNA endonuclease (very short patch repair protein)